MISGCASYPRVRDDSVTYLIWNNRRTSENVPGRCTLSLGNTRRASVTYTNSEGGTQQENVAGTWSKTFKVMSYPFFAYISAQTEEPDDSLLEVDIRLNGKLVKHSESLGRYVIATANGKIN
jgi:hypothetical protein